MQSGTDVRARTEFVDVASLLETENSADLYIYEGEAKMISVRYDSLPETIHIRFHVRRDAHLTVYELGEGVTRQNGTIEVHLEDSGATVGYEVRDRVQGEETHHVAHYIFHEASHTSSQLTSKVVLKDKSFLAFDDRIHVGFGARQCRGEQQLEALLFSEQAKIHTIPNLEIRNQEVRSKHGVSIRYLNPEWLFYLEARGLSPVKATELIEEGFLSFPQEYNEAYVS